MKTIAELTKGAVLTEILNDNRVVAVYLDEEPENPRTAWDNLGTILYTSRSYVLGDKQISKDKIDSTYDRKKSVWLPVYAFIHGGITLSTSPFHCRWDSGQSGEIYVTYEKIKAEYGWKKMSKKRKDQIVKNLKSEVETFNQYLSGSVYGFKTFDNTSGEEIDSSWGIYDSPSKIVEQVKVGAL